MAERLLDHGASTRGRLPKVRLRFWCGAVVLCACTTNVEQVKARAGDDFACQQRDVAIIEARSDIQEPTYEIEACGHRARYTCHDRRRSVVPSQQQAAGCFLDLEYPKR
jgi:hypothetical protein